MKLRKYSRLKFGLALGIGAVVASVLCVQCVRTYFYIDAVLVPQQAERDAERQVGALTAAARTAGIADPRTFGPVLERALESAPDRLLWMRVLDEDSKVLAQRGTPQGTAKVPHRRRESLERHESPVVLTDTPQGKVFVAMLPFHLPRSPHFSQVGTAKPDLTSHPPGGHRPDTYLLELAIPFKSVAGAFDGLRQNLVVGLIASFTLLVSVTVIGLRAPRYLRGRYLESEMRLARRVQSDLQPNPQSATQHLQFAAAAVAADHVGGDFYDIFEADSGKIAIVLGDVSGKGIPAALLVSVLQGAIRSSTLSQHERACERINRMLCERTACERFATLFWGIFDPATNNLRYVNAGHSAPMLIRRGQDDVKIETLRLDEGGPVLGLLPTAAYSAGTVEIEASDTLLLYSDGVTEATNKIHEEFGEERIQQISSDFADAAPSVVCERIMKQVTKFASAGLAQDDRTLVVVRFPPSAAVLLCRNPAAANIGRVA